jgi:hypothetical protein
VRRKCNDGDVVDAAERERTLDRLRQICLGLPETSERLSHGAPTFFVRGKRAFLMLLTDHHGDGRFAIWCAAPDGIQQLLVEADPERFFVPPYVGHRGWLGVRLDVEERDPSNPDASTGQFRRSAGKARTPDGRRRKRRLGLDWDELAGIAEDAYAEVAPLKLVEAARTGDQGAAP